MFCYSIIRLYAKITDFWKRLEKHQNGVTAIEYGLIAVVLTGFFAIILSGEDSFVLAVQAKFDKLGDMVNTVISQIKNN